MSCSRIDTNQFQSTPSARRATAPTCTRAPLWDYFNPRPPRGGRRLLCFTRLPSHCISIHALREEGDKEQMWWAEERKNFNPRPPRGGRPVRRTVTMIQWKFQSTPSARRATPIRCGSVRRNSNFNPRPPRGGRHKVFLMYNIRCGISIHALREEGDTGTTRRKHGVKYFNPRPPRGGRQSVSDV